uniref:Uncharacterized protein n=1 Tax=Anguilla anguilla TaxID=7936 RepID=A0A0E9QF15_ANGAN
MHGPLLVHEVLPGRQILLHLPAQFWQLL